MLYDPAIGRIIALLDFDFACILHPAYEFLRSFSGNGGKLHGLLGDTTAHEKGAEALRIAKIIGSFPSPLPASGGPDDGSAIDWKLAQAWEDELSKLGVKRPCMIEGVDRVLDIDEILDSLLPWKLSNEDFLRMNTDDDQRMAWRSSSEKKLMDLLVIWDSSLRILGEESMAIREMRKGVEL